MSIAPRNNILTTKTAWFQFIPAWIVGNIAAYFFTSYLSNFYPLPYQFVLLSLLSQLVGSIGIFLLASKTAYEAPVERRADLLALLTLLFALILSISAALISWQFPGLFQRQILFMDAARLPLFLLLSLISLQSSITLLRTMHQNGVTERMKESRLFQLLQVNLPGLLLAVFFLFAYFVFAQSINFPQFRTLDLYFDTDISVWLQRLTSLTRADVSTVRAVHPAILLYLRPVVWFLSIFLHGDRLQAVFLMHALAGAGCVFLTWLIVCRATRNTAYSLVIASLLGASASHMLLSSMFETYIYSALALLFFLWLIQNNNTALKYTVPVGIVVFGITVTNLIQTCILYFVNHPRFKVIFKYVVLVVFVTALLNILQVWLYPSAGSLFVPSHLLHEQRYIFNPFDFSWRAVGRFRLTLHAILLYGVVAPTPFILTEEIGMDVPNFRTYQILLGEFHIAAYRGLADMTVKIWIVILAAAIFLFLLNFLKTPKQIVLPLSLVLCLGFSFVLHLVYGDDPMLYSANWTYTLVLFVALVLQKWADRRWLQLILIAFLILVMSTNLQLIHQIMDVSAPFYSIGN